MGVIIFNGRSSDDYGIFVEEPPNHAWPEKDYDVVHVPGRSGDLLFDNGSYKNVSREYKIAVGSRTLLLHEQIDGIFSWLHSASGYARLEDSYEPEHFRLAAYRESGNLENILGHAGRATIKFDCKPQRFLKTGEQAVEFTRSQTGYLVNPTEFDALPLIKITKAAGSTGQGVINIGGCTISVGNNLYTSMYIDSEIQNAYTGTTNLNSSVTLNSGYFPILGPGSNEISCSGGISKLEVTPRWWTL